MGKAKSRANGDGDVFPRKNKAGKITSYRGAYVGPDGKRRYVSGKTKEEARKKLRQARGDAEERGLVFDAPQRGGKTRRLAGTGPKRLSRSTPLPCSPLNRLIVLMRRLGGPRVPAGSGAPGSPALLAGSASLRPRTRRR
jgi:hypothetical protein